MNYLVLRMECFLSHLEDALDKSCSILHQQLNLNKMIWGLNVQYTGQEIFFTRLIMAEILWGYKVTKTTSHHR